MPDDPHLPTDLARFLADRGYRLAHYVGTLGPIGYRAALVIEPLPVEARPAEPQILRGLLALAEHRRDLAGYVVPEDAVERARRMLAGAGTDA